MTRTNQSLWPPSNKNHTMYPKYNSLCLVSQELFFFASSWIVTNKFADLQDKPFPIILQPAGYDCLAQGFTVESYWFLVISHILFFEQLLFGTLGPEMGPAGLPQFTAFELRLRRSLVFELSQLNRACPIINIVQLASSNLQTTSWAVSAMLSYKTIAIVNLFYPNALE